MAITVAVVVLLAGLSVGWFVPSMTGAPTSSAREEIAGFLWPDPPAIDAFALTDHHGQAFNRDRLLGRWSMMYFGYTHCPDACPTSLSVMREVQKMLASSDTLSETFQGVFVSVDPARDNLAHLGQYVSHFSPRFLGVTGSRKSVAEAARRFGISFTLTEPDAHGSYLVDHSSSFLLVDPKGRLVAVLRTPHAPAELAERIERIERAVAG